MSNGPKFSGPAHVIFAELMGDDLTTIERILGRRVLGVQRDLHALIKQHGGYANIAPEALPRSATEAIGTTSPQARKRKGAKRA
jgi:hypothetical protein